MSNFRTVWKQLVVGLLAATMPLGPALATTAYNGTIAVPQNPGGGPTGIYTMTATGSNLTELLSGTSAEVFEPSYSPDGTKIAYTRQDTINEMSLWVMNANGTNQQKLYGGTSEVIECPSWSHDGQTLAFEYGGPTSGGVQQVATYRLDGVGGLQQLTNHSSSVFCPNFSPDGAKIVFSARSAPGQDREIFTIAADGSNMTALTTNSEDDNRPVYSPDGTNIVFDRFNGGLADIWIMTANGTAELQLTPGGGSNVWPIFSPDGTKILYTAPGTASPLMVMNTDGSSRTALGPDLYFNRRPTWQPLTLAPSTSTPAPQITLNGSTATLNVPSLYHDAYGSTNPASVTVTAAPAHGTTSVDSATGVITYTSTTSASAGGLLGRLANLLVPPANAAVHDQFSYRVCSSAAPALCAAGTASVVLGASLANTGMNQAWPLAAGLALLLAGFGTIVRRRRSRVS